MTVHSQPELLNAKHIKKYLPNNNYDDADHFRNTKTKMTNMNNESATMNLTIEVVVIVV